MTFITPDPCDAPCGRWAFRKTGPCLVSSLSCARPDPKGLRPGHHVFSLQHPSQGLAPKWDPTFSYTVHWNMPATLKSMPGLYQGAGKETNQTLDSWGAMWFSSQSWNTGLCCTTAMTAWSTSAAISRARFWWELDSSKAVLCLQFYS